jgi:hypothetical protein
MTTTKKTAKYYREILKNGTATQAVSILPEVIKKYGRKRWGDKYSKHNDIIPLRGYTEFEWNHRINAFFLSDKGELCVDIYWQGDSTDGNESLTARECMYGKVIPAVHEFIGGRTYTKHSDLRIGKEEFLNAVKAVAEYLSPENIKERKVADKRAETKKAVFDFIDEQEKPKSSEFWNGRYGVQTLLEKEPALLDKTFEEIKPIIFLVYKNNHKSDYTLRGCRYDGEKKYNIAY